MTVNETSASRTYNNSSNNRFNIETQNRLKNIADQLEAQLSKSASTKFIKFGDKETKTLDFDPNQVETCEVEYNPNEPAVQRVKFMARELKADGKTAISPELQELTASNTLAKDILRWLQKGYNRMTILRKGLTKTDTEYFVDPILS